MSTSIKLIPINIGGPDLNSIATTDHGNVSLYVRGNVFNDTDTFTDGDTYLGKSVGTTVSGVTTYVDSGGNIKIVLQGVTYTITPTIVKYLVNISSDAQAQIAAKAPLVSPAFTGTVTGVSKAMVGLGSVDNTSDAGKPVSTAQQTALNLKGTLASTNAWSGTNSFNVSLPTSTLTSFASADLITKAYADLTYTTGATVVGANNAWTGTNTYNINLPTSTQTPSSSSQLVTKAFVDNGFGTLTNLNAVAAKIQYLTLSGITNTFSGNLIVQGSLNTSGASTFTTVTCTGALTCSLLSGVNSAFYDPSSSIQTQLNSKTSVANILGLANSWSATNTFQAITAASIAFSGGAGVKLSIYPGGTYDFYGVSLESSKQRYNTANNGTHQFSIANAISSSTGFTNLLTISGSSAALTVPLAITGTLSASGACSFPGGISTTNLTTTGVLTGTEISLSGGTSKITMYNASTYEFYGLAIASSALRLNVPNNGNFTFSVANSLSSATGFTTLMNMNINGAVFSIPLSATTLAISGASVLAALTATSLGVSGTSTLGVTNCSTLTASANMTISGASSCQAVTCTTLTASSTITGVNETLSGALTAQSGTFSKAGFTALTVTGSSLLQNTNFQGTGSGSNATLQFIDYLGSSQGLFYPSAASNAMKFDSLMSNGICFANSGTNTFTVDNSGNAVHTGNLAVNGVLATLPIIQSTSLKTYNNTVSSSSQTLNNATPQLAATLTLNPYYNKTISVSCPVGFYYINLVNPPNPFWWGVLTSCTCIVYKNGVSYATPTVASSNGYSIQKRYQYNGAATVQQYFSNLSVSFTPAITSTTDVYTVYFDIRGGFSATGSFVTTAASNMQINCPSGHTASGVILTDADGAGYAAGSIVQSNPNFQTCTGQTNVQDLTINGSAFVNGTFNAADVNISGSLNMTSLYYRGQTGASMYNGTLSSNYRYDIFYSIPDFSDWYWKSSQSTVTPTIGTVQTATLGGADVDNWYCIYPGFRLVVYQNVSYASTVILDFYNTQTFPQNVVPILSDGGSSCQLYFGATLL